MDESVCSLFAFVTRRPYCPGIPKKLCFNTLSLAPTVLTARLSVVKQSFFGLPGQYGRRVTKANSSSNKWLELLLKIARQEISLTNHHWRLSGVPRIWKICYLEAAYLETCHTSHQVLSLVTGPFAAHVPMIILHPKLQHKKGWLPSRDIFPV